MASDSSLTQLAPTELISPTDAHVTSMLKRTQPTKKGRQFVMDQWTKIQLNEPAIARFIGVNAYRLAPEDPETREIIAASMVEIYVMLSEVYLQKEVFSSFSEALKPYFSS